MIDDSSIEEQDGAMFEASESEPSNVTVAADQQINDDLKRQAEEREREAEKQLHEIAARSRAKREEFERKQAEREVASVGDAIRSAGLHRFGPPGHIWGKCFACKRELPGDDFMCPACSEEARADTERRRREEVQAERVRRFSESRERALSTIPEKYADASFQDIELLKRRVFTKEAIWAARDLVHAPLVMLVGGAGAGKTTLGVAMLRKVIESADIDSNGRILSRAHGAMFVGSYWLAKARFEHKLGDGEAKLVDQAFHAPVLLLDDLGIEKKRDTAVAEVIYEREALRRQTIITTSISEDTAAELYGDGVARRLFEDSKVIVMAKPNEQKRPPPAAHGGRR